MDFRGYLILINVANQGRKTFKPSPVGGEGGGFFLLFSFAIFLFLPPTPCRFLVAPSRPSACIIAAIVFVLSDPSNVSLVNTSFLFSISLYLHFVSVVLYPPCPETPKKRKKKEKANCPLLVCLVEFVCWLLCTCSLLKWGGFHCVF